MNKYIKDYDEEKHEMRYLKYEAGIPIIVSKDIIIDEYKKEIERLNNIINELEKWLEDYHNNTGLGEYETGIDDAICDTIKKLKKLKGDSSNETNNNRL